MKTGINLRVLWKRVNSLDIIPMVKKAGFDAGFWESGEPGITAQAVAAELKKYDMAFQSIHAPFSRVYKRWEAGQEGDAALREQILCLQECAEAGVPIMVCHVFIGFGEEHPNDIGIQRFGMLLDEAERLGVKCAFENTEGEKYLEYLKEKLWSHKAAGFCIDTGHEMCYNRSQDMIGKYGDKLISTHLNDNMGITGSEITWLDDSHLMPFDGVADWNSIAERIKKTGFNDILTFELTDINKPERNTHDIYAKYNVQEFLNLAHERAVKVAGLFD